MKSIFLLILILLYSHADAQAFNKKDSIIIKGTANFLREGDTVKLELVKYGYFYGIPELNGSCTTTVKNSEYQFSIVLSVPAYFSLILSPSNPKVNLYYYLIEPGSNVSIMAVGADSFQFKGKDAEKLRIQHEKRKIRMNGLHQITDRSPGRINQTFAVLDSCSLREIGYLEANKKELGNMLYTILYADVLGESGLKIDNFLPYNSPAVVETWRNALINYTDEVWKKHNVFNAYNNLLQYSYTYASALIAKYKWDSCVLMKRPFGVRDCYEYFKRNYKGSLREKIITTLLYQNRSKPENISSCLNSGLKFVSNKDFARILKNIQAHLTKGSFAYKFNLPDTNGILHDYADFAGKVVLLDFWFTGCTACAELKPKMDSIAALYKGEQIVFISISIDLHKEQWISSIRKGIYTSEHSINLYTGGSGAAHPIISHYLIAAYPRLVVIDKEGKLCSNPMDPRLDNGKNLIDLINHSLKL